MKLNRTIVKKILGYVAEGLYKQQACCMAGIPRSTFYTWYDEGEDHAREGLDTLQRKLYEGIPIAQSQHASYHLEIIKNAAKTDSDASKWLLERHYPALYGKRNEPPEKPERDELIVLG